MTKRRDVNITVKVLYSLNFVSLKKGIKKERETGFEPATFSLEG